MNNSLKTYNSKTANDFEFWATRLNNELVLAISQNSHTGYLAIHSVGAKDVDETIIRLKSLIKFLENQSLK